MTSQEEAIRLKQEEIDLAVKHHQKVSHLREELEELEKTSITAVTAQPVEGEPSPVEEKTTEQLEDISSQSREQGTLASSIAQEAKQNTERSVQSSENIEKLTDSLLGNIVDSTESMAAVLQQGPTPGSFYVADTEGHKETSALTTAVESSEKSNTQTLKDTAAGNKDLVKAATTSPSNETNSPAKKGIFGRAKSFLGGQVNRVKESGIGKSTARGVDRVTGMVPERARSAISTAGGHALDIATGGISSAVMDTRAAAKGEDAPTQIKNLKKTDNEHDKTDITLAKDLEAHHPHMADDIKSIAKQPDEEPTTPKGASVTADTGTPDKSLTMFSKLRGTAQDLAGDPPSTHKGITSVKGDITDTTPTPATENLTEVTNRLGDITQRSGNTPPMAQVNLANLSPRTGEDATNDATKGILNSKPNSLSQAPTEPRRAKEKVTTVRVSNFDELAELLKGPEKSKIAPMAMGAVGGAAAGGGLLDLLGMFRKGKGGKDKPKKKPKKAPAKKPAAKPAAKPKAKPVAKPKAKGFFGKVGGWLSSKAKSAGSFVKKGVSAVGGAASKAWKGAKSVVKKGISTVKKVASKLNPMQLLGKAKGIFKGSLGKVLKTVVKVPVIGTLLEGVFATMAVKDVMKNKEMSPEQKQEAVGGIVMRAIGGTLGGVIAGSLVQLANVAPGLGVVLTPLAFMGGDFIGRKVADWIGGFDGVQSKMGEVTGNVFGLDYAEGSKEPEVPPVSGDEAKLPETEEGKSKLSEALGGESGDAAGSTGSTKAAGDEQLSPSMAISKTGATGAALVAGKAALGKGKAAAKKAAASKTAQKAKVVGIAALDKAKGLGKAGAEKAKQIGKTIATSKAVQNVKKIRAKSKPAPGMFSEAWDKTKVGAKGIWDKVKSGGGQAWDKMKAMSSGQSQPEKGQAWEKIKAMGGNAWDKMKSFGGQAWDKTKSLGSDAWSKMKEMGPGIKRATGTLRGTAQKGKELARQGVKNIRGKSKPALVMPKGGKLTKFSDTVKAGAVKGLEKGKELATGGVEAVKGAAATVKGEGVVKSAKMAAGAAGSKIKTGVKSAGRLGKSVAKGAGAAASGAVGIAGAIGSSIKGLTDVMKKNKEEAKASGVGGDSTNTTVNTSSSSSNTVINNMSQDTVSKWRSRFIEGQHNHVPGNYGN